MHGEELGTVETEEEVWNDGIVHAEGFLGVHAEGLERVERVERGRSLLLKKLATRVCSFYFTSLCMCWI